jgi:hypothetical protein
MVRYYLSLLLEDSLKYWISLTPHHIAITGGVVVAGGSAKDLGQLEKNVKVSMLNCNPAFSLITNDWSKKVQLGIKTKGVK